jgi:CRISPR-associated endonuclease/helicase Cas3
MKIMLEGTTIGVCQQVPAELTFLQEPNRPVLAHQVHLYQQSAQSDILFDLAPTGTGKTQAGLLALLHNPTQAAVYIAPTNALLAQQAEAARTFVKKAKLPHYVIEASAKDIREWEGSERPGEKLNRVLQSPATYFKEAENRPILLVTNPDIFYYGTMFQYQKLDRTNVAVAFTKYFSTLIFDEFHLYDAKQVVGMVFYLILSQVFGYFNANRKVIMLSATPEPTCEALFERLETLGTRIARIRAEEGDYSIPAQAPVHLELRVKPERDTLLTQVMSDYINYQSVYEETHTAIILDSLDHINRLGDTCIEKHIPFGKITGPTPKKERIQAMDRALILATATVDVGFNFERTSEPLRQNLDVVIFSAQNQGQFWQRLGRVGRVLGKHQTDTPAYATAYIPEWVWEICQASEVTPQSRIELEQMFQKAKYNRPFHDVYWRSEALLEIARPLQHMEELLKGLPGIDKIEELFNAVREVIANGRGFSWADYRRRIQKFKAAEHLSYHPQDCTKGWTHAFFKQFIKDLCPDDWAMVEAGEYTLFDCANYLIDPEETKVQEALKEYATKFREAYRPIFRFRQSLFGQMEVEDPQGLISQTEDLLSVDALHVLRYYEIVVHAQKVFLLSRANPVYNIRLGYEFHEGSRNQFENLYVNRPTALHNVKIFRESPTGGISSSEVLKNIDLEWLPGLLICPIANARAIGRLKRQGIYPYDCNIEFLADLSTYTYAFFPHLEGWLALAKEGVKFKLPEGDQSWFI